MLKFINFPRKKQLHQNNQILKPDEFMRWFAIRFMVLGAIGSILSFGWTVLVTVQIDPMLEMFIGGFSVGMMVCVFALYRTDLDQIIGFADFARSYSAEMLSELHQRRKIEPGVRMGCVYVIQDINVTGFYKIGKTTAPADRIGHFDIKLPFEIRVVHIIESKDCNALEAMLHRHFDDKRKRGEWFQLSSIDIEWLLKLEAV